MTKYLLLASLLIVMCSSLAQAQVEKCKKDISKYCEMEANSGGSVEACLKRNKSKVSAACLRTIRELHQGIQNYVSDCEDDARKLCAKLAKDQTVRQCLESNKRKLNYKCKKSLKKLP